MEFLWPEKHWGFPGRFPRKSIWYPINDLETYRFYGSTDSDDFGFRDSSDSDEEFNGLDQGKIATVTRLLGGGFKYFLFSPLLGEMIQFD